MSKPQPLRRPPGATIAIEQALARGDRDEWIVQRLHVTAEQVEITLERQVGSKHDMTH